jgi:hypothetical protein
VVCKPVIAFALWALWCVEFRNYTNMELVDVIQLEPKSWSIASNRTNQQYLQLPQMFIKLNKLTSHGRSFNIANTSTCHCTWSTTGCCHLLSSWPAQPTSPWSVLNSVLPSPCQFIMWIFSQKFPFENSVCIHLLSILAPCPIQYTTDFLILRILCNPWIFSCGCSLSHEIERCYRLNKWCI